MEAKDVKIGKCYHLTGYGQCVVIRRTRKGFWVEVWGGPSGDQLYRIAGVGPHRLSPLESPASPAR